MFGSDGRIMLIGRTAQADSISWLIRRGGAETVLSNNQPITWSETC